MDDPTERDEERNKLVEAWHAYGAEFTVFVPQQQPAPTTWDPDVEEFDEKGRTNPHYLKHWKFLAQTKDFLRARYAKYKILQGPALIFDCLIRKFQRRIFNKSYQDEYGNPVFYEVNDSYEWYERAIRMNIFEWQSGFVVRQAKLGVSCGVRVPTGQGLTSHPYRVLRIQRRTSQKIDATRYNG